VTKACRSTKRTGSDRRDVTLDTAQGRWERAGEEDFN
jgi:hypothetical protein